MQNEIGDNDNTGEKNTSAGWKADRTQRCHTQ